MSQSEPAVSRQTLRMETVVDGPPERVADYVAELQHMERWWPQHWRYRRLSGDGGPGTRYYWIVGILPGVTRIEVREPGRLAYRTAMAGLPIRMSYEFSPAPGGTLVRAEMHSAGLRLGLFAGAVKKQLREALSRLAHSVR